MKNYSGYLYLITIFMLLQACDNNPNKALQKVSKEDIVTKYHTETDAGKENKRWINFVNTDIDALQYLYSDEAVKALPNGEVLEGAEAIVNHYSSNSLELIDLKSDTLILANEHRAIEYEIVEFSVENGGQYKSLVIWQTIDGKRQRVFEFDTEMKSGTSIDSKIKSRRDQWMILCNNHNATELVNEMYSVNTLYFNHKPILKGRGQLIVDYAYMNDENYELVLQPSIVQPVNADYVFEIGQCKGSYNGKYILIWKRDTSGKWFVFIDSNI